MKKVVGFENWYSVTDDGHIFSHHRDVWLKPSKVGAGYHRVGLYYLGKTHNRYVHRIVAEAFIGPSNGREINHKNGEKTDNRVENLEWVTRSQNNQHKHYELGHAIKPVTATCLTTGNILLYASVEKTKIDGFEPKHVSAICLGKRKMHKGYTFEFTPSPPAQQEPVAWKLVPREPTHEMLNAMDECSTEGYDERLYAGHAASVYMAAVDAAPTPPAQRKPLSVEQERKHFEYWYSTNAFDYESNPIGSRECGLQWQAWKARAAHNIKENT